MVLINGLDDAVGRLSNISDAAGVLEAYQYLGMSTVFIRSHPQSGVSLSYVRASGEGTGDGGDQYTRLDRFDRVTNQKWVNGSGTIVDQNTYTYDRDGNVLTKGNPLHTALNATYGYDGLNRLTSDTKGGAADQSWTLDPLGNSASVTTAGTAVSRTNNSQNQLTNAGGSTLTYDGNGNTTMAKSWFMVATAGTPLVAVDATNNGGDLNTQEVQAGSNVV